MMEYRQEHLCYRETLDDRGQRTLEIMSFDNSEMATKYFKEKVDIEGWKKVTELIATCVNIETIKHMD